MTKSKVTTYSREWARDIVSFARSKDESHYNLMAFHLEPSRIVATDGHRLAWQTFETGEGNERGQLIDEHFNPIDGEMITVRNSIGTTITVNRREMKRVK